MKFGECLKEIRKRKGMSQQVVADKLNVTQQTVAQYEKADSTPKLSTVKKLADALDVPYTELLNSKGSFIFDYSKNGSDGEPEVRYIAKENIINAALKELEKCGLDSRSVNSIRLLFDLKETDREQIIVMIEIMAQGFKAKYGEEKVNYAVDIAKEVVEEAERAYIERKNKENI